MEAFWQNMLEKAAQELHPAEELLRRGWPKWLIEGASRNRSSGELFLADIAVSLGFETVGSCRGLHRLHPRPISRFSSSISRSFVFHDSLPCRQRVQCHAKNLNNADLQNDPRRRPILSGALHVAVSEAERDPVHAFPDECISRRMDRSGQILVEAEVVFPRLISLWYNFESALSLGVRVITPPQLLALIPSVLP